MRIIVSGDHHYSQYSSILRNRGLVYSKRLENIIDSMNWLEDLSKSLSCDLEVYLGDFFDKPELNAEELTALNEIKWNHTHKNFLVGNHEMEIQNLSYSSAHLFNLIPNSEVIDKHMSITVGNCELCFIPYVLEENRKTIKEYFGELKEGSPTRIIFSHNDIKGLQLGPWISQTGFDINEIKKESNFYFNGHIHNGEVFDNRIFNVGNMTGQNFSEDGFKYIHGVYIIDIDDNTGKVTSIENFENPYAIYFYKLDFSNRFDQSLLNSCFVNNRKCVLSIKCKEDDIVTIRDSLPDTVYTKKFIVVPNTKDESTDNNVDLSVDHLEKFKEFVLKEIGTDDITISEILEVIK